MHSIKKYFYVLFIATIGVNLLVYPLFLAYPQAFYYRAWEYFREIAFHNTAFPNEWNGLEHGSRSRDNFFLKQESFPIHASADDNGYRSTPALSPYPGIIFFGDSQMYGSAVQDNETLPWRMSEKLGVQTWNGADRKRALRAYARNSKFKCVQLVVDTDVEFSPPSNIRAMDDQPDIDMITHDYHQRLDVFEHVDPRRYNASFGFINNLRRLWNDASQILFPKPAIEIGGGFDNYQDYVKNADTVADNRDFIEAYGFKFIYMPIYSIRSTLAPHDVLPLRLLKEGTDESTRMAYRVSYSYGLTQLLRKRGVNAVDFSREFKAARAKGIQTWHTEDDHWNGAGTKIAADILAAYIQDKHLFNKKAYDRCVAQ